MSQNQRSSRPDLMAGVRVRIPLVFVVPIGALLLIAVVTILFSQVLLALPKEAATTVALAFAANILIACAVLALRKRTDATTLAELFVVVSYPVVIGIVLAVIGFGSGESVTEEEAGGAGGAGGAAQVITAQGVAFDTKQLSLPAGEDGAITIDNQDSTVHNLSIYEDDSANEDLFIGPDVGAGSSLDYTIPPLDKGNYYFQCDYHSSMNGDVTVE
ncbi:MAG: cupredoxin domain-containing protein [Actinomycetota bacterium]